MSDTRHRGAAKQVPAADKLLLPYQESWVRDRSRLKLAEKSRQIGWTWATAYSLVRRKALKNAKLDAWISSRDEGQARLFLEDCKAFAELLQLAAQDLGEQVLSEKGGSAFVMEMGNGLRLHSMSSNPDAQAGKRGDRVLDEFALHPDPRKLYSIAYPGITWGGQLEIFSTHRGGHNYFNRILEEARHKGNPKGISIHRVTLQDALEQGFLHKLQQKLPDGDERLAMDEQDYFDFIKGGCADEESFMQEYMCVPADDESAFLSYDLISSCLYKHGEYEPMTPDEAGQLPATDLYVGVDVGRDKDLTCIYVIGKERGSDVKRTIAIIELQAVPFRQQEEWLYPWLDLPNMRRCLIDQTGLGRQFAERAQEKFGKYRVEGVNFSGPVKEELAYPVRAHCEDRTLRLPDDRHLVADLRKIRKTTTAAGNIRFDAQSDRGGHADRFWALALALSGSNQPRPPTHYESIRRPRRRTDAQRRTRRREVLV